MQFCWQRVVYVFELVLVERDHAIDCQGCWIYCRAASRTYEPDQLRFLEILLISFGFFLLRTLIYDDQSCLHCKANANPFSKARTH